MHLTITNEAKKALAPKLNHLSSFLLTLNDGSNQFSSAEGCCLIGDRFLIVPIQKTMEPFTKPIENEEYHVFTSEYDTMFLTGELVLDVHPSSGTLLLKNESGLLDSNVLVKTINAASFE